MKLFQRILSNLSFFIAAMLLFLLFFQNKVVLPAVLQTVGRMHPMLLHLPIGLFVLVFILWLFKKNIEENSFEKIFLLLLHVAAFTALLTALMGFFLSKEGGYEETILNRHKLLGVLTSILAFVLLLVYKYAPASKKIFSIILFPATAVLLAGSHFGSNLTRGVGYVWQPVFGNKEKPAEAITDSSALFTAAILPVLKTKCFSCHNETKAKGKLVMTSVEKLLAGGKGGPIWKAGDALNSHIIQNINLPEDDKKHMPPQGKPQLTTEEAQLLFTWIQSGADIKKQLREYEQTDSLKIMAMNFVSSSATVSIEKEYPFAAASASVIEKLNDPFCVVFPVSQKSPALQANFFIREKYNPKKLDELLKVKEQLVILNLDNMPVADAELVTISKFSNLEKIVLNNSNITNKGLAELLKLKNLQTLSIAGTKINKDAAGVFNQFENLKEVFIWNTEIKASESLQLKMGNKKIVFNTGYIPDEKEMLVLTPPTIKNETFILTPAEKIEMKHQVPGVVIRYTTDGTVPDSTTSPLYKEPVSISGYTMIKARAVKEGWLSSPVAEFLFFTKGIQPQKAELLTVPNKRHQGDAAILIDGKKGTAENFNDIAWLGFREQPFAALFYFDKPQSISSVSISYNKDVPSYLMPPTEVEVWGGNEKNKLRLLKKILPPQTTKEEQNTVKIEAVKLNFAPSSFSYYKVVAKNIKKLPAWHPGKGDSGWFFIDELFFNE